MLEKVWAIKGREEKVASNGNKYLQVTVAGDDGKDHRHNLYEQGMWDVFRNNDYVKVELDKPSGTAGWKVMSAIGAGDALPPPQSDQKVLEEHQEVIDKAVKEGAKLEPKKEHNPQEIGLAYKVLAELYVAGFIDENMPDGKALIIKLKSWLKDVLLDR